MLCKHKCLGPAIEKIARYGKKMSNEGIMRRKTSERKVLIILDYNF